MSRVSGCYANIPFSNIFSGYIFAKCCKKSFVSTVAYVAGFFLFSILLSQFHGVLKYSFSYGSALIYLIGISIYHKLSHKRLENIMLIATCIFIVSLTFRTIDLLMCEYISFGTHFFWHIMNSIMLYLLMKGLIINNY